MTEPNYTAEQSKKLQMLWADGTDLSVLFGGLKAATPLDPSMLDDPKFEAAKKTALGGVSIGLDRMNRERSRDEKLIEQMRRDLVAERVVCIGRRSDDNRFWLEKIESSFWLGARIYASADQAENEDILFDMIRIASNASTTSTLAIDIEVAESAPGADLATPQRRRGRPSHRDKILAAIEHQGSDEDWFVANAPHSRHLAYRRYIKAAYRIDTLNVEGFDAKTIEKYETEFRQNTGR